MPNPNRLTLALLSACLVGCAHSNPDQKVSAPPPSSVQRQATPETKGGLAHQVVQIAKRKYLSGNFDEADTILQAALEIDPKSPEALYYLELIATTRQVQEQELHPSAPGTGLWYPTLPPRPAPQY
jgi:Tfp pilus assembly protein PilF